MELTTKNLVYVTASIGAILWGYFGVTDSLPIETLLGLGATTAGYIYAVVGLAGLLSLLYTAAVWSDIDPTVVAGLYILADVGAILWGVYWYTGSTPTDLFGFLSGSIGTVFYLAVAFGGVLSLLIAMSYMDEDSNTTDASDALDG